MDSSSHASEADLYALREFLNKHYTVQDMKFRLQGVAGNIFKDLYLFTYPTKSDGKLGFQFRRAKALKFYDIAEFIYSEGSIHARPLFVYDRADEEKVDGLVSLLENKPYSALISNLEGLHQPPVLETGTQ